MMATVFAVVCEVGLGNFTIDRYNLESEARSASSKLWCCWVLYSISSNGTTLEELAHGGVGFSHPHIRKHAEQHITAKARDADARAAAAAAAEARAAKVVAAQPKAKAKPAAAGDGRPDVSNPSAWD